MEGTRSRESTGLSVRGIFAAMASATTTLLRRLPAGASFVLRSTAGTVITHGRVLGPGAAGGVVVIAHNKFDHQRRPLPAEWSGRVTVEPEG